ncbi:MAG: hypothetical protein IPN69_11835 [Acidobacteria bacterium]|nr:hypothetical protein [Acidobacteriota bacterium]
MTGQLGRPDTKVETPAIIGTTETIAVFSRAETDFKNREDSSHGKTGSESGLEVVSGREMTARRAETVLHPKERALNRGKKSRK